MTDRTADWQLTVRAKRLPGDNRPVSNIFRSTTRKSQGSGPAAMSRVIMAGIEKTAKMLKSSECAYTSVHGGLSDAERDELDSTTGKFISDCGQRIDEVNTLIMSGKHSANELAHLKVVHLC
jgi:hypothetical protein